MSEEPTDFINKPATGNGSYILGVSVRAWLAIVLTITVCVINIGPMLLSAVKVSVTECVVEEPLYSAFLIALGFFFGQKSVK